MAVTLGSVGTAIAGFAVADKDAPSRHKGAISQTTVQHMSLLMLPISICMIAYALFTFYWRSEFIRKKQASKLALVSSSKTLFQQFSYLLNTPAHPFLPTLYADWLLR